MSENPSVCQAVDCPEHNHELKQCDCADGNHFGAFEKTENKGLLAKIKGLFAKK